MTCGQRFHDPGVSGIVCVKTFWLRRTQRIFITQWHSACVLCMMKRRIHFSFSQTAGIHYKFSFSICPFIFSLSGDVSVSVCFPWAMTVQMCTDGRQKGQFVYCSRPCQLSWTSLAEGFPQAPHAPRPLQAQPVCVCVCEVFGSSVKPYTDKFRPKTEASPQRCFSTTSVSSLIRAPTTATQETSASVWDVDGVGEKCRCY